MKYEPTFEEKVLFIVFAALSGVYYLFVLSTSEGNVFSAITSFMIAALVGYVAMITFNATITTYLANTIAKLRIQQAKIIVKEACGKELKDDEAATLILKANSLITKRKKN